MKDLQDLCKSALRQQPHLEPPPNGCGLHPSLFCLPAQISNLISHSPHCHPSLHSSLLFSSNNPNSKVIPALDFCTWNCLYLKSSASRLSWLGFCSVLRSGFPDHLFENPSRLQSLSISPTLLTFLLCTYHCVNDIASWLTCVVKAWILSQPFFFCP